MENQQISRKKLIELYKKFDCSDWRSRIKKYLDSSSLELDTYKILISNEDIKYANLNASNDQKKILEEAGIEFPNKNLFSSIKNMDDVWEKLGIKASDVLPFKGNNLTKKQKSSNAQTKLQYIFELFNQGWIPNFLNTSEYKYYCWFQRTASGWVFVFVSHCGYGADVASGFFAKDSEIAKYIGTQFIEIWKDYLPE